MSANPSASAGWHTAPARGQLFAALILIGFINGISEPVTHLAATDGWLSTVVDTLGISVIVWGALLAAVVLLWRAPPEPVRRTDVAVALLLSAAFIIPVPALSWLALTGFAAYLIVSGSRTGLIVLALTFPMFWAKAVMAVIGSFILEIDAALVSAMVGTERTGNLVPFADGSGALYIAPGCSSFDNISLAILCSATLAQLLDRRWSLSTVCWALLACAAVVVVNTLRVGLMALYPRAFDLLHGPVGAGTAGWVTTLAILALCHFGVSRSAKAAG